MRLLGNFIWFVSGGWALFLIYAFGAVVFFPVFLPLFRLAKYSAWPFGRSVVSRDQLDEYKKTKVQENENSSSEGSAVALAKGSVNAATAVGKASMRATGSVLNILWLLSFGLALAMFHLLGAVINLFLIFLIVTIPNIGGNLKLIPVALMPFNKVIVPERVAEEIREGIAKNRLGI
jgi:uncharacterized membrane protein YccF (DUF307 family)